MKSPMLKEALRYLEMGLSVIPLRHKDKKPLISWDDYQKRRPQEWEVKEWWATWPDANIGIVTGRVSGLVVVDVDGEKGLETAKRLGLPKGPTVKTGKGYHRYFRHPGNGRVSNFQCRSSLEGVDLRGDGGYVVAPPSIHESGKHYEWIIPLNGTPLPPLPEDILAFSPEDKPPATDLFNGVSKGERNNALASIAGTLFAKELDYGNVLQLCLAWNTYNKPPLADKEVDTTVESIYKTHRRNHPDCNITGAKNKNSILAPIESDPARIEFWTPVPITELKDSPPIDWLWDGYIARGRITELVGIWKSGKTTLVAHLLKEMAHGGEMAGKNVSRAKVLIISEEDSSEWKERKDEYGLGEDIDLICIPFKTKPSRKDWEAFTLYIRELASSYDLIVIDTIANNWSVIDENSNSEVITAMMPIRAWAQEGVGAFIIHHCRKGDGQEGQASRGAGGLPAFVDILLEFRRYDPSREDDTRRTIKGYSRRKETPREVVIELIGDNYKLLGTKSETKATERLDTLLSQLPVTEPGATGDEMKDGWPSEPRPGIRTLKEDLETLHREGKIKRTGAGKKGSPYRYWLEDSIPAGPTPIVQESNFLEMEESDLTEVVL